MRTTEPLAFVVASAAVAVALTVAAPRWLPFAAWPAATELTAPVVPAEPETVLFSDDFERGLSQWTDGPHRPHSAEIVVDPLNPGNSALHFRRLGAGADLVSVPIPDHRGETYGLRFDYLGTPAGSITDDLGGYVGVTNAVKGLQLWLAGTNSSRAPVEVVDDGAWHSYSVPFKMDGAANTGEIRIMLEDFDMPGGVAGDAYFDNVAVVRSPTSG